MKSVHYLYILLILIGVSACEETVTLDTTQIEPRVVIEGEVTDQYTYHYVKVSRSTGFYDDKSFVGAEGASVTVVDSEGQTYNYIAATGENSTGLYFSEERYAGIIGRTYTLTVTYDNNTYTASDKIFPVTAIDSLTVEVNEEEMDDPDKPGYFYEILFYAKEPQESKDYYLFKFYRNDTLILDSETDIYYADDELLAEKIDGIPTAGFYKVGDQAKVEMYSISQEAFVYLNDLSILLTSDGGMFSPPPANPRTNLSNNALGFFRASAKVSDMIEVK